MMKHPTRTEHGGVSRSSTQPHRQGRPRLMTPRRASCRAPAVVVAWRPPRQLRQLTRAPIRTPLSQQLQTQLALTRIDAPSLNPYSKARSCDPWKRAAFEKCVKEI